MRRLFVVAALLSACGDPQHSNPFDPSTPAALQAKATLAGTVSLEASGAVAPALGGVTVQVLGLPSVTTDPTGAWKVENVPAGTYTVRAINGISYEDAVLTGIAVTLDDGGKTLTVPDLRLRVARGDVHGFVTLEGEAVGAYSGIAVTLAGIAGAAFTDATGAYAFTGVPVIAASYSLTASKVGFTDQITPTVNVILGQSTAVPTMQLPANPGSISGNVTVQGATSYDGVTVQADGTTLSGTHVVRTVASLASGAYSLTQIPAGTYNVTFSLASYESVSTATNVAPGTDVVLPAVGLVRQSGTIIGSVVLAGSGSSAGVQVAVYAQGQTPATPGATPVGAAITDATGAWRVDGVPVGVFDVYYSITGYAGGPSLGVTVLAHAVVSAATVTLAAIPGQVQGKVLLEGATAGGHGGTTVRIENATGIITTSAADGSYTLTGVGQGAQTVVFERAGFDTQRVPVFAGAGQVVTVFDVSLAISRGTVRGQFQLPGAASSAGIVVSASGPGSGTTITDPTGAFSLGSLPVGTYSITARLDPSWSPATVSGVVVAAGATTTIPGSPVALSPVSTSSISGTALAEAGAANGTTVTLSGSDFRGVAVPGGTTTTTAVDGSWSFGSLRAGSYQITFSRAGYESPAAMGASIGAGQALGLGTVTLLQSRGAVGGVFQLAGAASSAGIIVSLQGTPFSTVTDATGAFTISSVPVGTYTVVATDPPNWQGASVAGVIVSRNATTPLPGSPVLLQPVATAAISGVALLELQANASGSTVTLSGVDFRGVSVPGGTTTTTDAAGAWSFSSLRAGSYQVSFTHASFDSPPPVGVSLVTGSSASVGTLTLAASRGSVAGTATATGASNQAGTVVTVSGGPDTSSTVTDGSGAFRIDGLRVGSGYTATFTRTAYASATSSTFSVMSGATTALGTTTLSLATTGSISGSVAVERGSASGVTVTLAGADVNGAAVNRAGGTGAGTTYTFTGLPAGTYALTFGKTNYDPQTISGVVVGAGVTTASTPTLQVSRCIIAGQVTLSASTVSGTFALGADLSGTVLTLEGTDVTVPTAVTDASGAFQFTNVPVPVIGAQVRVTARRPNFVTASSPFVTPLPNATTGLTAFSIAVNAGGLTGFAKRYDNVANSQAYNSDVTLAHANLTVSITGTAFNGSAYSAQGSTLNPNTTGTWTITGIPPGSYDILVSDGAPAVRVCDAYLLTTVPAGATATATAAPAATPPAAAAGTVACRDVVAPGALVLGNTAAGPGVNAQSGYTNVASATVPVTAAASDATAPNSNFRGYQLALGAAPNWATATTVAGQPASLVFTLPTSGGFPVPGSYTLWARGVDWLGNTGPAASAAVIVDTAVPTMPSISTARGFVDATSASVTLSGSDADPNFFRYEACVGTSAAPGTACSAIPSCALTATVSAYSVSLTANQRNCVWARARDKAGNASAVALSEIVSDLTAPVGPTIAPLFDPSTLTVHAEYADFFITSPATDAPAGGGPWANIAWIEVDSGAGFTSLCPADACHASNTYNPCACSCTDPRLVCRGGSLYAVRVPLLGGTATNVSVRSVDVAGNVGSGASQQVPVAGLNFQVTASSYDEDQPRVRGRLLTFTGPPTVTSNYNSLHVVDLGANQVYDASDTQCEFGSSVSGDDTFQPMAEPISPTAIAYVEYPANSLRVRRPGGDGKFCTGADDTSAILKTIGTAYPFMAMVSGSLDATGKKERIAWVEQAFTGGSTVYVIDGGTDKVLGTGADDITTTITTGLAPSGYGWVTLSGDTLLYGSGGFLSGFESGLVAVNAVSGSFVSRTTWTLPGAASVAGLDEGGRALAYFANEGGVPTLHVRYPTGGQYTSGDLDVKRSWNGPTVFDGGITIRGSHVILTEASVSSGPYYIDHWYAGADGLFGTADDTFARILPSALPRYWPALGTGIAGGQLYVQSGTYRSNADVIGYDLSALRWDVAGANPVSPVTNRAGTTFYTASSTVFARTSDGRETTGPGIVGGWGFAADASNLFVPSGNNVVLYHPDPTPASTTYGQFFVAGAPAPATIATLGASADVEAAGGGRAVVRNSSLGTIFLLEPNPTIATPTVIALDSVSFAYWPIPGNVSIAAGHLVFSCMNQSTFAKVACFREPGGAGGAYGGSDRIGVLTHPNNVAYQNAFAIAVSGDRVALVADGAGGPHLFLLDAGTDKKFGANPVVNDDVETDFGLVSDAVVGSVDFAGSYLAWSTNSGSTNGRQIYLADVVLGTQRILTSHFSGKPLVVVDPTGRVYWQDTIFSAPAIFVSAP